MVDSSEQHQELAVVSPTTQGHHHSHHRDGMREIRAMVMSALPCPPMPLMSSKEVDGVCEDQCCSSHDLMAHLMNVACVVCTQKQNQARAELQARLQSELFDKVDEWKRGCPDTVLPPIEWSYQVLGDFTRKYAQSYMADPTKDQDVRFLPVTDINRYHPVHVKAVEFQRAQDVLYGKCSPELIGKRMYERMSYAELVQVSIARILESGE